MSDRESFQQARNDLDRAREEADNRFNEWAALLAKEAAESALITLLDETGTPPPTTDKLAPLVRAAFGNLAPDHPLFHAAERIDEIHAPAQVDLDTATPAQKEGGNPDYVTQDNALEAITHADTLIETCQTRATEHADD